MTKGIGSCNLKSATVGQSTNLDMISFDYDHTGCNDHILAFNRATNDVWILRKKGHSPGTHQPVKDWAPLPTPGESSSETSTPCNF